MMDRPTGEPACIVYGVRCISPSSAMRLLEQGTLNDVALKEH
jgi:hypothetical protein